MNIEEKKETMALLQKFFVKSFVVSFVLMVLASFACVALHDFQLGVVKKLFNMDEATLTWIVVLTLSLWKLIIVQFTLVPALVIWCMRHCCKCNCGCETK